MTKPKDITCCIVLFKNDKKIVLEAINSFLNTKLNIKLFLVDNSPTDALSNIIDDPRVVYIYNPTNPGFGAAHNLAIAEAFKEESKYHLVLNPDVYFGSGVLESIVEYMEDHTDVGNLMPKVEYPDGSIQYLCKLLPSPYDWIGRRFNPIRKMVEKRNQIFELRFTNYRTTMKVPYLSGCFMFLRTSALKVIGFFDEGIFMYGEEADLCRRFILSNYKTMFYPEVKIVHHFEKGSHKSIKLTIIGIRSAIYYFNKWGWFFDKERRRINRQTLLDLGHDINY